MNRTMKYSEFRTRRLTYFVRWTLSNCALIAFSSTCLLLLSTTSAYAESKFQPTSFPPSVAVCLHVEGLEQRYNEVVDSGLKSRIEEFPPYRTWVRSKDFYKIQQVSLAVQALTGEPAWKVANQLFGESVFVGLIPKNDQHPDFMLMATRAKSAEVLQKYLKLWNDAEQAQLKTHIFKGRKYLERQASGETVYYTLEDRDIVFASHKISIEGVISATTSRENLASADWYREADQKFDPQTPMRLFINPRAFDSQVKWNDDVFQIFPELKELWKSTFAVTFGLRLNEGIVLDLHLRRHSGTGEQKTARHKRELFSAAPAGSLVAFDGVTDFAWFGQRFIATMQMKSKREAKDFRGVVRGLLLGNDLFDNVLTDFNGQWSLWIVPDTTNKGKPVPIDAAMQLNFKSVRVESNQTTDVAAMANLGQFLVNLMTVGANVGLKQQATTTVINRKSDVTIAFSDGVRGWSPGFAIDQNSLRLFTNPRFVLESPTESSRPILASSKFLQEKQNAYFPAAQSCGWIDLNAIDQFIDMARKPILDEVISAVDDETIREQKKGVVTKKIDRFQQVVRLGDALFVSLADLETDPHFNLGLLLKKP